MSSNTISSAKPPMNLKELQSHVIQGEDTHQQFKDEYKLRKSSPKTEGSSPKTEESSPKTEESSPKAEESSPKTEGSSPKTEESSPKTEGSSPKTEEKILMLVSDNEKISTEKIGELLGITKRAVLKQIEHLKKQGRLERVGPAKGGFWRVMPSKIKE